MTLGFAFELVVDITDMNASLAFYEKLGFEKLVEETFPVCRVKITDGVIVLSLQQTAGGKTTLTYFSEDAAEKTIEMERLGVDLVSHQEVNGRLVQATICDPNGFEVSVIQASESERQKTAQRPISKCGQFGELSIESDDVQRSICFWTRIGFKAIYDRRPPVNWANLSDGQLVVGLYKKGYCRHVIKTPSITYFEANMCDRIQQLKREGMHFIHELAGGNCGTCHAIAEAPEGQLLFLVGC